MSCELTKYDEDCEEITEDINEGQLINDLRTLNLNEEKNEVRQIIESTIGTTKITLDSKVLPNTSLIEDLLNHSSNCSKDYKGTYLNSYYIEDLEKDSKEYQKIHNLFRRDTYSLKRPKNRKNSK